MSRICVLGKTDQYRARKHTTTHYHYAVAPTHDTYGTPEYPHLTKETRADEVVRAQISRRKLRFLPSDGDGCIRTDKTGQQDPRLRPEPGAHVVGPASSRWIVIPRSTSEA